MARPDSLATLTERLGPYFGGGVALVVALLAHSQIASWFAATGMSGKEAVGASFNVFVTLTAFLFSVFVLALAPGGGFLQTIFNTVTFRIFKRYVVEALALGALASLWSIPFMSTPSGLGVWQSRWAEATWIGLSAASILSFFRVAHIFMAWVSMRSQGSRRAS